MRNTLKITALCAVLIAGSGCVSAPDVTAARAQEQRAEQVLEDALALPEGTPGRAALIADATDAEADLERERRSLEARTRDGLIGVGVDVGADVARGNYVGALEGLFGLLLAAGTYALSRKKNATETESRLADLEARRDATRAQQGIAPSSARSADLTSSLVALAAKAEANRQVQAQVQVEMERLTTLQAQRLSAPLFPVPPVAEGPIS